MVVWPHHVGMITGRTSNGEWIVKSGNDGGGAAHERPRSITGAIAFRASLAAFGRLLGGAGTVAMIQAAPIWERIALPAAGGLVVGLILWIAARVREGAGVGFVMEAILKIVSRSTGRSASTSRQPTQTALDLPSRQTRVAAPASSPASTTFCSAVWISLSELIL